MDYYKEITSKLKEGPMTLREITKRIFPDLPDREFRVKGLATISSKLVRYKHGGYVIGTKKTMLNHLGHVRNMTVYSLPEEIME